MKSLQTNILAVLVTAVGCAAMTACTEDEPKAGGGRTIAVETLPAVGRVDERFQSYNVESVEVTGGNFWAPYPEKGDEGEPYDAGPHGAGFATDAYRKREPLDLMGNQRLRMLTEALGPAYMRVSGTWANSIYFQNNDEPIMDPPEGYQGVLTRAQWAGVVDFAEAVDARILTSFAVSDGARDDSGAWQPDQAAALFEYTQSLGGTIDAVELMNEPNVRHPEPYAAEDYARDHAELQQLIERVSPNTKLVGPGSTGEAGFKLFTTPLPQMSTARLLSGEPQPHFDVFSYHFYGAVSQRCKSLGERDPDNPRDVTTSADDALTESWLSRAEQAQAFYSGVRDRFAPGAPIWITETAQAACGGDPWSSTFLDTFRYVDQLGRFARQGASVVFHNTLAASDYSLIDDETWLPRPNYWAALLWRRLMGQEVLDTGSNDGDLHTYAHCLKDHSGGVAVVAINLSPSQEVAINLPVASTRYTLTAPELQSEEVALNGEVLGLTADDSLPALNGVPAPAGNSQIAPASVNFFAVPGANNHACR